MESNARKPKLTNFKGIFLIYDNFGDGKIPVCIVRDVMRALGQNPTEYW